MIAGSLQTPINPHAQRLLAASKRTAKVDAAEPGANNSKAKEPKAKGKAKAPAAKKAPKVPKVSAKEIKEKAKNDYMEAKNKFMEKFFAQQ